GDKIVAARGPRGDFDFQARRSRFRAADILRDRLVEDYDFLTDESNQVTEIRHAYIAQVDPIDLDRTRRRIIKTQEQLHERALAGAVLARDSDLRAAPNFEIDTFEDALRFVGKTHPAELDGGRKSLE